MTAQVAEPAADWFLSAHPDPSRLAAEWREHPRWTGQLPAVREWDAVTVPQDLGDGVLEVLGCLFGVRPLPVLADGWNRRTYFFT